MVAVARGNSMGYLQSYVIERYGATKVRCIVIYATIANIYLCAEVPNVQIPDGQG